MKIFDFDKNKNDLNQIDPVVKEGNMLKGPPNLLANPMSTGTGLEF